jgi:hypothetical protein
MERSHILVRGWRYADISRYRITLKSPKYAINAASLVGISLVERDELSSTEVAKL